MSNEPRLEQYRDVPEEFLVAFSFAGEQRDLVRSIATAVERLLGRGTVFFDEWFEYYIAGHNADIKLQKIYLERAVLVIPCLSQRYGGKPWTLTEHAAIRALQQQLSGSEAEGDSDRILPLRVGDGEVPGILFNTISPDVRNDSPEKTAYLILHRLRLIRPEAIRSEVLTARKHVPKMVYLAECMGEMIGKRQNLRAFLEDENWKVLPTVDYEDTRYEALLEVDLKEAIAFVQLLEPYPWKRGGFDRLQNEKAEQLGMNRFRFRSSEFDLGKVDPLHRQFLTTSDVISSGFEDFKRHLKKELDRLWQIKRQPDRIAAEGNAAALVRIVVHSTNPDSLWERVYQWFYDQRDILPDLLEKEETFRERHSAEACHGFLIVCDVAACEEGPYSPKEDMRQCRELQMKEKDDRRRPPVGLVYWPPPPPPWHKLLRATPLKLHRIQGDAPANLGDFFAEVRGVVR